VREVFALGPRLLQFDDENNGASHYSGDNHFDCTAFLSRLAGEESNGRFVNCTDCASIVGTFANALGCNLSQARMAAPPGVIAFPLNPHKRIGLPGLLTGSFRFHEVAWEGACGEADDVFDACLLLNGNNNPSIFRSKSASNLPFGFFGERHYRFRLVPKGSESNCLPVAGSAVRRKPGPTPQGLRTGNIGVLPPPPPPNNFVRGFSFGGFKSPDFHLQRTQDIGPNTNVPVIKSFWKDKNQDSALIRVDTYECASVNDARKGALHLLDDFELEGIQPSPNSNGAILEFENSANSTVLFALANMVFLSRNVGATASNLSQFAASLKQYILPPANVAPSVEAHPASRFHIDGEGVVGRKVEIEKSAEGDRCSHHWFSSDLGEVLREGNKLLYEPARAGDHTISIWSLEAGGVISFECVALRVT
jgi:hypothetical protein